MPINFNKKIQTEFDVSPPVLSFNIQPTSQTVDYRDPATLNVFAVVTNPSTSTGGDTPSGTISYQWYKDGAILGIETSSSLSLPAQTTTASYYCEASFTRSPNTSTAINSPLRSNTATISVKNQINITSFSGASGKTITLGESYDYSIDASVADGQVSSLIYEWYVNNKSVKTDTTGGSSSSLTLNPDEAGDYSIFCRISQGGPASSASPSVVSNTVTLKVEAPPPPPPPSTSSLLSRISIQNQKSDSDGYKVITPKPKNPELNLWYQTSPTAGYTFGEGNPPTGGGAINFGVGQWEISAVDRDMEVIIELAGAAGQGCKGHDGSSGTPGQGGVGIVYLKMVKGQKYTLQIGRIGSAKKNNYPNENSPGGGQSGEEADLYSGTKGTFGNGGGGTFLYKGGKLIAVAGGGGGAAPGARIVGKVARTKNRRGGNGGGPGLDGEANDTGEDGGTGGTQFQPGDNKNTALYKKDSADSRGRPRWMLNGVCSSWVSGTRDGACDCTISNSTKTSIVNGQRTLDDDDPSNKTNESCNTYARSKVI